MIILKQETRFIFSFILKVQDKFIGITFKQTENAQSRSYLDEHFELFLDCTQNCIEQCISLKFCRKIDIPPWFHIKGKNNFGDKKQAMKGSRVIPTCLNEKRLQKKDKKFSFAVK